MSTRIYHVWFSTKYPQAAPVDVIGETVKTSFREIASKTGIQMIELALELDHVHLLLELDESMRIASAMHRLKGASAREVFSRYPQLKLDRARIPSGRRATAFASSQPSRWKLCVDT